MKIEDPKVTLADEARNGVEEAARSGFLDWLFEFHVTGDDGELYGLGGSILSLAVEKMDLVTMCYCKGTGTVRQLKNSIYKVGAYPGCEMNKFYRNPQGTLQIDRREHSVLVRCGEEFSVECFDNGTWHFILDTLDGFIPAYYNIKIAVEDGLYEVRAHVGNARTWGVTYKVPDNPVATLIFDDVQGKFTYKDGSVKVLTGGRGSMSVRQWHAYPNMLLRALFTDEEKNGEKFDTL